MKGIEALHYYLIVTKTFMKNQLLIATISLFFLICCDNKNTEELTYIGDDNIEVQVVGTKSFPLDSITSSTSLIEYFEVENNGYLGLLNTNSNSIYIYDYDSESILKILSFPIQGPNSVGRIEGFHFHNFDSLFIHSQNSLRLYLSDTTKTIKRRYDLSDSKGLVPSSSFSNDMPMFLYKNNYYINAWGHQKEYYNNSEYPNSLLLKLDLETGNTERILSYPSTYVGTGVWGIQFHFMWNAYDSKTGEISLSFPIDRNLYFFNQAGELSNFNASSNQIDKIRPLSEKDRYLPSDPFQELKVFQTQSTYYSVYYDPYNKLWLRFINVKMNEDDFDSKHPIRSRNQNLNVVMLDSTKSRIGEVKLSRDFKYFSNPTFINEKGVHINVDKFSIEDSLHFDIIKFIKND
ncbi:DUF4221 family protein [Roseivirga sp. UBA1976]|uniref:DUF4221 family protein n=1 Tax=Roseivirga sp. UBA1976 TaxID=1947386 RepID=UPI00257AC89D|nr:DUF4221 family protein [Roseivirga sp. UBA1976]MEC7752683.1 DUF4221 family protein [Bacteroidota bacterium]|tara:strand:+ start:2690 stop:3904 length:1215 start_codon:yes stop_codon:yes gene_type:complete